MPVADSKINRLKPKFESTTPALPYPGPTYLDPTLSRPYPTPTLPWSYPTTTLPRPCPNLPYPTPIIPLPYPNPTPTKTLPYFLFYYCLSKYLITNRQLATSCRLPIQKCKSVWATPNLTNPTLTLSKPYPIPYPTSYPNESKFDSKKII